LKFYSEILLPKLSSGYPNRHYSHLPCLVIRLMILLPAETMKVSTEPYPRQRDKIQYLFLIRTYIVYATSLQLRFYAVFTKKLHSAFFQCIYIYICHDVTQAISEKALLLTEEVSFILVLTSTKVCHCYHSTGKILSVGLHVHSRPTKVFDTVRSYRTNFPSSLSSQVSPYVTMISFKAGK
jgi:hypothetical protein